MGQFLLAGTGTLSFAILFACPRRSLPTCAPVSYTHLTGLASKRGTAEDVHAFVS